MFEELPRNHYGVIYADCPWQFNCWSGKGTDRAVENHYDTMSVAELSALPVGSLAAPDCALIIWICWPILPEALEVIKAWGFDYKSCAFSWMKADVSTLNMFEGEVDASMGMGYYTRANSEAALLATRGNPKRLNADVRQGIIAPKREHSRKPDGVHQRIERLFGGPYLDLFARQRRKNWTSWGDEIERFPAA